MSARENPRVTGIDYRLTMRRYRPAPSHRGGPSTVSLYLTLSCRPSWEWVRAFRGEMGELGVEVPPRFSLYHRGHLFREGYRSGRGRTGVRRWVRRALRSLVPSRQMRLVVSQCAPDLESVRAAMEEARAVLRELDTALREADVRGSAELRRHEEQLEQLLKTLRASEPAGPPEPPRGPMGDEILSGGPTAV